MSAAPATAGAPAVARETDPFRAPKVRHAMHLIVPRPNGKHARVIVLELKAGLRLSVDIDDDGIGVKHVDLAFPEANKLSDMLNAIRRRAVARESWRP